MSLVVIGVNHHQSVEFREKLAFAADEILPTLRQLTEDGVISGAVILSTCHRVEVYFYSETPVGSQRVLDLLSTRSNIEPSQLETAVYHHEHAEAIRHLLRVCSGVDSLVLGEPQILEQVKLAYQLANDHGTVGSILGHILERSFAIAKRLRTETDISSGSVSTSRAAVELVRQHTGSLSDKRVLILGAGKIGTLAARYFDDAGVRELVIMNRTFARAETVASLFEATARPLAELPAALQDADVVVSCTSAESLIITKAMYADVIADSPRPRVLVDLAVPRDIDPAIRAFPEVVLFDVDTLDTITDAHWEQRQAAAQEIEHRIEQEATKCQYHIHSRQIGPMIQSLRNKAEHIRREALEQSAHHLEGLSDEEQQRVDYLTRSIINKILHTPVTYLKQQVNAPPEHARTVQQLFGLDEEADR